MEQNTKKQAASSDPRQRLYEAGIKSLEKVQDKQINEAAQSGVPLESIFSKLSSKIRGVMPDNFQIEFGPQRNELGDLVKLLTVSQMLQAQQFKQGNTQRLDSAMGVGGQQAQITDNQTQQSFSKPGATNLMVTGGSISEKSGRSLTLGESPQSKSERKIRTDLKGKVLDRASKIDELLPLLEEYENTISTVPVGTGVSGRAMGIYKQLETKAQADPFAATIDAQLDARTPSIAKSFGDVANIALPERKQSKRFFPQIDDSDDVKAVKMVNAPAYALRRLLQDARSAGVEDDPLFTEKADALRSKVKNNIRKAAELGVSPTKLFNFVGPGLAKEIGVKRFNTIEEANKANLTEGDLVIVGNKFFENRSSDAAS